MWASIVRPVFAMSVLVPRCRKHSDPIRGPPVCCGCSTIWQPAESVSVVYHTHTTHNHATHTHAKPPYAVAAVPHRDKLACTRGTGTTHRSVDVDSKYSDRPAS